MSSFVKSFADYVSSSGKRMLMVRGTLTLTSEGGTTGDIPASLFGLSKIRLATPAIKSDDSQVQLFAVGKDDDELFAVDIEASTDADRANPADLTGDWIITVIGE
jgi:hypothetical protein